MGDLDRARPAVVDAATAVLSRDGLRALSDEAIDEQAGLPPGTAAAVFPDRERLVLAINDRIVADSTAAWLSLGPLAPTSIEEFATRFAAYATLQVASNARMVRARVELMLAYPEQLIAGHLALGELIQVVLDRLGVPEPASRGNMVVSVVDGTIVRHCSIQQGQPVDEVALARAIKRIIT